MKSLVSTLLQRSTLMVTSFVLAISSLSAAMPLFLSQTANAVGTVNISSVPELCNAIDNQADGQTWTIEAGTYGLGQCNSILAGGQTGWYMPITKNDITINGVGNPTIYGTGYTANGAWATQNLISVFGDNVTINGLTLMPKVEPNKTIEVMGDSATIENVTITPNTLTDQTEYDSISDPSWKQYANTWGGSIYYNNATGTQTISNVTINNGGVSVHSPGTTFNVSSLNLTYTSDVDWLNDYRFYVASPTSVINGTPTYNYHVNATLDNFDSVLAAVGDPTTVLGTDTISLDSNLTTTKQITITKPVTLNGNGNKISAGFNYTSNSNNSVIGITGATGVTVNNLTTDGSGTTGLHGINVYESTGVNLNDVTVKNNGKFGLNVNSSNVTVNNINTSNNTWGGVDVDPQTSLPSVLKVNGTSTHNEVFADLYIDDTTKAQGVSINDTNNQYSHNPSGIPTRPNDQVYNLKPAAPTLIYPANNEFINTNDFWFDWQDVSGAAGYEFQTSQNPSVDANGSLNTGVWTGDYQHNQPTASTLHSVGASGTWYWQVRTVNAKGTKSDWSSVWKMSIDMTKPSAPTITSPSVEQYFTTTPILNSWSTSTDDFSGINHYQIAYGYDDGHSFGGSTCSGLTIPGHTGFVGCRDLTSTSRNHTPGTNEQGGVTIWVRSFDNAGNASNWSAPVHYTYDATAPNVPTLVSPSNNAIVNGSSVTQSWSDASTDIDHYIYQSFNDAAATQSRWTGNFTTTSKTATNVADGTTYWWRVIAVDHAGNQSAPSPLWKITIDSTAPVVDITAPGDGDSISGTVTVSGTVTDTNPHHYYFVVKDSLGHVKAGPGTVNQANVSDWTWDTTGVNDGVYTIDLEARDAAGNKNANSVKTISVTVDNTAPVVSVTAPTAGNYGFISTVNINADIDDAVSYRLLVNGSEVATGGSTFTTYALPVVDGTYNIQVEATDAAGNVGTSSVTTINVDDTAPVLTVVGYTGTSLTPPITGTTDSATDIVTVDGATATVNSVANGSGTFDWTYTLPTQTVGSHTITVISTDTFGNATTETANVTVNSIPATQTTPASTTTTVTPTGTTTTNTGDQAVLGAETTNSDAAKTGDSKTNSPASILGDATSNPMNLFGLAWYWWLAILAAIIALWWAIAAALRRRDNQNI